MTEQEMPFWKSTNGEKERTIFRFFPGRRLNGIIQEKGEPMQVLICWNSNGKGEISGRGETIWTFFSSAGIKQSDDGFVGTREVPPSEKAVLSVLIITILTLGLFSNKTGEKPEN